LFHKITYLCAAWRYSEIHNTLLIPNYQKNFSRSKIFLGQRKKTNASNQLFTLQVSPFDP